MNKVIAASGGGSSVNEQTLVRWYDLIGRTLGIVVGPWPGIAVVGMIPTSELCETSSRVASTGKDEGKLTP